MKQLLKKAYRKLPKRLTAAVAVAVAIALPVASISAATVRLEGSLGVANVTAGDTKYQQSVNAKYDEVVKIQVYYHNREDENSGKVAENLRVKVAIPKTPGKSQVVHGTISADNANIVQDDVTVNLDRDDSYLEYIPGSAVWKHNKGTNENVQIVEEKISDEVVFGGQGVVVESAKPCFNFDATITVLARVRIPGVKIDKTVRVKGTTDWSTNNTAKPGDTLEYQIAYKNAGNSQHEQVLIRDNLPKGVQYVPGSTKLKNSGGVKNVADGVSTTGIIVGNYNPGAAAYVLFEAKLPKESELECDENVFRNVGVVRPKGMNEFYNIATTKVEKVCEEPEKPTYDCKMVSVEKIGEREVRVSVDVASTGGAKVKDYTYDFGDGSTPLLTDKDSVEYSYANDGEYNVRVKVRFDVNGEVKTVDSESCSAPISFKTPEEPEEPEEPGEVKGITTLPSTGPEAIAGVFASTTIAGAVAHRFVYKRYNK